MSPFQPETPSTPVAEAEVIDLRPAPLVLDEAAADLLFRSARTANTFTDEPITDEQMRAIHDLIQWGPTSMNGQPMRVTLVRSAQARERLVARMAPFNAAKTAAAPLVAILSYDVDFHDTLPEVFPHAPGARDMFADEASRHAFGTLNGAMQAAYFILGIRAAGLAAGPMAGFDAAGIDAEFFADGRQRTFMVVNIGHPGEGAWFDRLPRLDYDRVVRTV